MWQPARYDSWRGRPIGVFVAVLVIAALHTACGPIDRSPSSPTQPAVLARSRLGQVIQDGVGYGGVRIGMTSDELSRAWGPTVVARSTGQAYDVWTFRLDTGETILAMLKGDKVESLQFIDFRRPGETPLRTSQGVEMGDLVDRARSVYGDPEEDEGVFFYYFSEGIAFGRDCPWKNAHDPRRVSCVLIFQKARLVQRVSSLASGPSLLDGRSIRP